MSREHKCEVVVISQIAKHPNADRLGITRVFGYQCIVNIAEFHPGMLAVFIPPESLVPLDREVFAFLKNEKHPERTHARVGAKRLRKEWSEGLLLPLPTDEAGSMGWAEGDDLATALGVTHYEPPEPPSGPLTSGKLTRKPPGFPIRTYDVEALRRYKSLLVPGEQVLVTEKIHGSQARYTYRGGVFHVGSKGVWRAGDTLPRWLRWVRRLPWCGSALPPAPTDAWTRVLSESKQLQQYLRDHPGHVVYGEVYGSGVQDLTYGCKNGEIRFAAFHVLTEEGFMPQHRARNILRNWKIDVVPVLYEGPYSEDAILPLAEGLSVMPGAGHLREGCVVAPFEMRTDTRCGGPVHLKVVSRNYLERGL